MCLSGRRTKLSHKTLFPPKIQILHSLRTYREVEFSFRLDNRQRKKKRMNPYVVQSNKIVCNIPEEGINRPINTGLDITDEASSDAQVVSSSYAGEMRKVSVSFLNEESRSEILRISSVGREARYLKKKLLVLDVNGLLADIVSPPPKGHKADAVIARRAIFKRPFYLEFLKFCFEKFEVGVWSSRIKKNVERVLDYLMGDLKHKLLFCWDLSHCTSTSFNTLENSHKPLVFKDLRKIWEKHDPNLPWENGYYNELNTLLLDDSPYKASLNPLHTSVFPHTYRFLNKCDNSLAVGGDLRVYLDGLAKAENMREYVEQNPFGQEGISERSNSWKFYFRVISSLSTCQLEKMSLVA